MTWAAMDVHARSTYTASLDVVTGELSRQRFDTGAVEPVVGWLVGLPGPVRACYEAGPTGVGLDRAAGGAGGGWQGSGPAKLAGAGARVLRGEPDRVRPVPGGGRGGDRLSGDRAIQDAASVGRSQQVRPPGHRPAVASADGRRADTGHGPVSHVRGGEGPGEGARAGQARPDALPASALEAAVAPRLRVGPHGVDSDAPSVALSTDLRASEHRAGVHRQPRRLRRADRPPASARRAALLGRAGPGVLAAGPPLARVPRPGHALGADRRARGRRLHQVPPRGAARIVARASALAPAVRGARRARVDHQHRLYRIHRRMRERKKPGNVITVACARELACFLWAAATAP